MILNSFILLISLFLPLEQKRQGDIPVYSYEIVNVYPHDTTAFTQGLFFKDGYLFESTGQVDQSTIRKVELETGNTVQVEKFPAGIFGEGIIDWGDRLIGLSWRHQTGFEWDINSFKMKGTFEYPGEGWGLTRNDTHILMSDGTPAIRFLDPETLNEVRRIEVKAQGRPLININELEWVDGEIFANIWQTDFIARINPENGDVVGLINLRGLLSREDIIPGYTDVLNGIAVNAEGKLFVTGKYWPKLFEIRLVKIK
ncbi:glutaminyl-peptide cyclotransferase [Kordiimonas laminariae]|uniref:glutaminyl-peptide cyclotransferase n=1 Tax=Kordiimonas laminariae TaxID=2917717 RepID=UPI001FF29478|nr:glutaminyl-peptide cyclotransferase [Kordiimonas laminariae]MCK0068287.1 glutaminyl-peptide cyclotransferase [Kordiimonas laminariae]